MPRELPNSNLHSPLLIKCGPAMVGSTPSWNTSTVTPKAHAKACMKAVSTHSPFLLHPLHIAWEVFACHIMSQTRDSHALPQFILSALPQPLYCCSASLCHLLPWRASSQGLQPANLCRCALTALPSLEQGEQTDDTCTDAAIAIFVGGFIHHQLAYC